MIDKVISVGSIVAVLLVIVAVLLIPTAPESESATSVFGLSYSSHYLLAMALATLVMGWLIVLVCWDVLRPPSNSNP